MRHVPFASVLLALACLFVPPLSSGAAEPTQNAYLVGGETFAGQLQTVLDGRVTFRSGEAATTKAHDLRDLVRWGHPPPPATRPTVVLRRGSRLVAAPAWSLAGSLQFSRGVFMLRTTLLNDSRFERKSVSQILYQAVRDPVAFASTIREANRENTTADRLWLANGDAFTGKLTKIDSGRVTFVIDEEPIEVETSRVVLVKLASDVDVEGTKPAVALGLRDGSLVYAGSVNLDADNRLSIRLADDLMLSGRRPEAVAYVQPLQGRAVYLADLQPLDYRQTPYFELGWRLGRDSNLAGGPLVVADDTFLKGLAMHSASRLVYRVPAKADRFAADVAVLPTADSNSERNKAGSVIMRVLVARQGKFQPAYASQIVRSGESPQAVSVDVVGAQAVALVVEYADGGDAGDHAAWLDARFELSASELSN